ncbi:MAG: ferrochelatase, partial [Zetaproteobacteria bacterium]
SAALARWRDIPDLVFISRYYDHPAYIEALATRIERYWAEHGRPDRLLCSFHGIPERYARAGDPYPEECRQTVRLLRSRLQLAESQIKLSFQSRFGREPWLQPYTDETLRAWGRQGLARADVVCPGFSADCLETLEEIAMENRDVFLTAGGGEYHYIPALNADDAHIACIKQIVSRYL